MVVHVSARWLDRVVDVEVLPGMTMRDVAVSLPGLPGGSAGRWTLLWRDRIVLRPDDDARAFLRDGEAVEAVRLV